MLILGIVFGSIAVAGVGTAIIVSAVAKSRTKKLNEKKKLEAELNATETVIEEKEIVAEEQAQETSALEDVKEEAPVTEEKAQQEEREFIVLDNAPEAPFPVVPKKEEEIKAVGKEADPVVIIDLDKDLPLIEEPLVEETAPRMDMDKMEIIDDEKPLPIPEMEEIKEDAETIVLSREEDYSIKQPEPMGFVSGRLVTNDPDLD